MDQGEFNLHITDEIVISPEGRELMEMVDGDVITVESSSENEEESEDTMPFDPQAASRLIEKNSNIGGEVIIVESSSENEQESGAISNQQLNEFIMQAPKFSFSIQKLGDKILSENEEESEDTMPFDLQAASRLIEKNSNIGGDVIKVESSSENEEESGAISNQQLNEFIMQAPKFSFPIQKLGDKILSENEEESEDTMPFDPQAASRLIEKNSNIGGDVITVESSSENEEESGAISNQQLNEFIMQAPKFSFPIQKLDDQIPNLDDVFRLYVNEIMQQQIGGDVITVESSSENEEESGAISNQQLNEFIMQAPKFSFPIQKLGDQIPNSDDVFRLYVNEIMQQQGNLGMTGATTYVVEERKPPVDHAGPSSEPIQSLNSQKTLETVQELIDTPSNESFHKLFNLISPNIKLK